MCIETMRQALLDAHASGYISFDEASPIAEYIADLDASSEGYIFF